MRTLKRTTIRNILMLIVIFYACNSNTDTEKYQNKRKNIVIVKDKVAEIKEDSVLIGSIARLFIIDDYLLIADYKSEDMLLHLFNKNNYEYITSAIPKGQGPYEITNMGHIGINDEKRELYVADHGKLKIFTYPLDSILNNSFYKPSVKKEINNIQFPSQFKVINDTLAFARMIEPTGNVGFNEFIGKWNIQTGEVVKMKYSHPDVKKRRVTFAVSMDNKTLVECYHNLDLMTIMDIDGNLKYNVYGQNWNSRDANILYNYQNVFFRNDNIIASYSGGDMRTKERRPDKLFVFDINGDYIKTLDIGYRISNVCYDEENDRIVFVFDDIIQFGYLDLKGII